MHFSSSNSHLIFFFSRFFFASVSTQMIRERKIFELYITSTRTQVLLVFRDAIDSLKSKKYKKNILCVNTSCKWRTKSNKKRKSYWNNRKKLVWSRNELKNILVDVAKTIRNLTTTSSFTNIFVFDMRRSRNLLNNLSNLLFHLFSNRNLIRLFDRWFFHFSRHFSFHRSFYLSRFLHQKLYANVQRTYYRNQ